MHIIDNLQYANWSEKIFKQMREGGVDAVHVTIAYHEIFREMVANIEQWNRWFESFPDLICHARSGDDVRRAKRDGRTAIIYGWWLHGRSHGRPGPDAPAGALCAQSSQAVAARPALQGGDASLHARKHDPPHVHSSCRP